MMACVVYLYPKSASIVYNLHRQNGLAKRYASHSWINIPLSATRSDIICHLGCEQGQTNSLILHYSFMG